MAKPIPGVPRLVWGPTPKKGRFQVVVETADTERHARTFTIRDSAVKFAEEQRARIEHPAESAPVANQGSPAWWRQVLSASAAEIEQARVDPLQKGRVLASLGAAAAKHSSDAETDARISSLEDKERQRTAMRKHGPKAERQRVPTTEAPIPGTPVYQ